LLLWESLDSYFLQAALTPAYRSDGRESTLCPMISKGLERS